MLLPESGKVVTGNSNTGLAKNSEIELSGERNILSLVNAITIDSIQDSPKV